MAVMRIVGSPVVLAFEVEMHGVRLIRAELRCPEITAPSRPVGQFRMVLDDYLVVEIGKIAIPPSVRASTPIFDFLTIRAKNPNIHRLAFAMLGTGVAM